MQKPILIPEGRHDPLVYFIRLGSRVKIGYTTHLAARITGLSLATRFVVLTLDGGRELETQLHRHFAAEREEGTEWFAYSRRLRDYIVSHQEGFPERSLLSEEDAVREAERLVLELRIASASMLKRRLRISWGKAQRLMNELERRGVVSELEGRGCSRTVLTAPSCKNGRHP